MFNKDLPRLINHMLTRNDGIPGSNNQDCVAVLVSEAIDTAVMDYMQDYLKSPTYDNAAKFTKRLVDAVSNYAEDTNLFDLIKDEHGK